MPIKKSRLNRAGIQFINGLYWGLKVRSSLSNIMPTVMDDSSDVPDIEDKSEALIGVNEGFAFIFDINLLH